MNVRNSLRIILNYMDRKWFIKSELNRIREFEIDGIMLDPRA